VNLYVFDSRSGILLRLINLSNSSFPDPSFSLSDPNSNAAGNSKTSPSDAANFQTFLGELRTALPSGALLTAAVSHLPFIGSDGSPVGSVARAAEALDYILIMNYDVWGSGE